jgi:ribosomal-protein-alanine N-acetyltransferase
VGRGIRQRRDPVKTVDPVSGYFFTTPRLGLRWWTPDDLPLARELWGNPEVLRYLGGDTSEERVASRLQQQLDFAADDGVQYWPIFELDGGGFVGCTGLRRPENGSYRHGFHLLPRCWGRGYGFEAAGAVLRYGFEELDATSVTAGRHPDNAASGRLLERLGFVHVVSTYYRDSGLWHPNYELTPTGFAKVQAGRAAR